LPHGAPDLAKQFAESLAKSRIPKFTSGDFSINPTPRVANTQGSSPSRSIPQYQAHGAPSISNQVLSNESQAILSIQDFVHRL
jgi:hypothetical protein